MFEEILLLLFFSLVGVVVVGMLSSPLTGLLVGVALWGLVQFVRLIRLRRWLGGGTPKSAVRVSGLWGDVYRRVLRFQQTDRESSEDRRSLRLEEGAAALPYGIVIVDSGGRIEWLNSAASRVLLLSYPGDVGREIKHLIRQSDFVAALESEEESVEVKLNIAGKHLVAHVSSFGEGGYRLVVVQDLSRVHYLERARSELLGNVAHELKTPLTVIAGYAEIIAAGEKPGNKTGDTAAQIGKQAERMNCIIDDLLMLGRLESGQLPQQNIEAVNVRLLAEEVVQEALVGRSVNHCKIEVDVAADVTLRGNRGELHSVLSNLVSNALRYSPEGGSVRVSWSNVAGSGGYFAVSDEGVGIDSVHLQRLTERFYRVDKSRSRDSGGTGLGLAIVKRVLQRHGASLRVESELGKGSVFYCDFPADAIAE